MISGAFYEFGMGEQYTPSGTGKCVLGDALVRAIGEAPGDSVGLHGAAKKRKMAYPSYPNLRWARDLSGFFTAGFVAVAQFVIAIAIFHHRHADVRRGYLR